MIRTFGAKIWGNILSFLFIGLFFVGWGIVGYFYWYKEDYINRENHEKLKEEFKDYQDSIKIEFKLVKDSLKLRDENIKKLTDQRNELKVNLSASERDYNESKKLLKKINEDRKQNILENDTISNDQADLWLINKFGG